MEKEFMTAVITQPFFFDGETDAIISLFANGLQLLHLRKPDSSPEMLEAIVRSIPEEYYDRIVLHDHHSIAGKYSLGGVHLNGRNPLPPQGYACRLSCSCHSLEELSVKKGFSLPYFSYFFLSPVFDSISKQGYASAFTLETIAAARKDGIVDSRVFALGGISLANLPLVKSMGFGGAALLGDIWAPLAKGHEAFVSHFKAVLQSVVGV